MREAAHHLLEAPAPALGDAIGVVDVPRSVDRDPDQVVVVPEELSPLGVEQRPVRLDRMDGALARLEVCLRDRDRASEEVEPHQRRLAALPRDRHLRCACMGLDQLTQVCVQLLVGHPEAAVRVEHLLGEEEAVVAVEVALRARRLREQVERRRGLGHLDSIIAEGRRGASPRSVDIVVHRADRRRATPCTHGWRTRGHHIAGSHVRA